jgi:hypothetical protein
MPVARAEWGEAMEAEASAIASDYEALRWAFGCFVSSQLAQPRRHLQRPGAFVPLAMSLIAMVMVLVHAAAFGIVHEADEGTPAHVFQLLMVAQLPMMALFTLRWLPTVPGPTLQVLVLQIGAAACAVLSVLLFT